MIQQPAGGQGGKGGAQKFNDPDFLMTLAGAVGGLSHNKNPAYQQMVQMGIQGAQQKRAGSRTAEWLRKRGYDDLAQAVTDNPSFSKQAISEAMNREKPKETFSQADGTPYGLQGQVNINDLTGKVSPIVSGGSRTNVNVTNKMPSEYPKLKAGQNYISDPDNPGEYMIVNTKGGDPEKADNARDAFKDLEGRRGMRTIARIKDGLSNQTLDLGDDYLGAFAGGQMREWLSSKKGTPEYTLGLDISTLRDQLAFGELRSMREMSKTGGAVGQLTDREREALGRLNGAVEAGMREGDLRDRLSTIEQDMFLVTQGDKTTAMSALNSGRITEEEYSDYIRDYDALFGEKPPKEQQGGGWQSIGNGVMIREVN